ncbi:methyltransferase N6AMT1 [Tribolium madens]|uniref:methyltransferase N6AMT1 n=1 Tax=Tribolium madens TaxID=41895 RepID=UPI001CF7381C|nr:methyltransferase N6AMT1 [Tribolium madens]
MLLKTPQYDLRGHPEVYEPSEDSFLLLDALEQELGFLEAMEPVFALEIGSGSGIAITALATSLKCECFATDINPDACVATSETAKLNRTKVNCVNMNLFFNFRENLFDIILFNPPYVVTDSAEISGYGLSRAWAGGRTGREITDRVLCNLQHFLTPKGVCYMVILKENNIDEIMSLVCKNIFRSEVIKDRKIRGEHLFILKFSKAM